MQQQALPSPAPDPAIPTRPAALALLALDAVLLGAPLIVRWHSWFVFAYVPLLFTVGWGVMLGGIWKTPLVVLFSVPLLAVAAVGIVLALPGHNLDRLGYVLVGGQVALAGAGIVVVGFAVRGWILFFGSRAAA